MKTFLICLLIVVVSPLAISQSLCDFELLSPDRYDSPPVQYPEIKIFHVDIVSENPCSNTYTKWAKISSGSDYFVVGPLSATTSLSLKYTGPSPNTGLIIEASASLGGSYSAVGISYSGNGACYTIITDVVDQNYYVKVRRGTSSTIKIDWIQSDNGVLPVELVSFTANLNGLNVVLKWKTATEVNNFGFEIEKSTDTKLFTKIGFVAGHGTSSTPNDYTFIDKASPQTVSYRLKQIDRDGSFEYSPVVKVASSTKATELSIVSISPNTNVSSTTNISYTVPFDQEISLVVYDIEAREVMALPKEVKTAGLHTFILDVGPLKTGTYFLHLRSNSNNAISKFNVVK